MNQNLICFETHSYLIFTFLYVPSEVYKLGFILLSSLTIISDCPSISISPALVEQCADVQGFTHSEETHYSPLPGSPYVWIRVHIRAKHTPLTRDPPTVISRVHVFSSLRFLSSLSQCPLPVWPDWHDLALTPPPAWAQRTARAAAHTPVHRWRAPLVARSSTTRPDRKPWRCPAKAPRTKPPFHLGSSACRPFCPIRVFSPHSCLLSFVLCLLVPLWPESK